LFDGKTKVRKSRVTVLLNICTGYLLYCNAGFLNFRASEDFPDLLGIPVNVEDAITEEEDPGVDETDTEESDQEEAGQEEGSQEETGQGNRGKKRSVKYCYHKDED
jgi:hypothetical protein